jgi:hypothetical protein
MYQFEKIVIKTSKGGLTVIVDDKLESELTKDEALAVVATAFFSNTIAYVKDYDQWLKLQKKYNPEKKAIKDPRIL